MKRLVLLVLLILPLVIGAQETKIKFASLAPRGSTWVNVMDEYNQEIKKATQGQISFRIYPGGVSGNEVDVLRKIRSGQLHSGGFTGVALGEILPEVRIFDSPFLFKNSQEVDFINQTLHEEFSAKFKEKGFILLGWAEVGFVYIFTKKPITNLKDIEGIKMWMWEGDPVAQATFSSLNCTPIPLSVTDVLTSLQTGMIDGFYISPLGAISLQWYTKAKYMLKLPLANSTGAVLLSKKEFDKFPPDKQKILMDLGKKYMNKLVELCRKDNEKSILEMQKKGLKLTEITSPVEINKIELAGIAARKKMAQHLFTPDLLEKVETNLKEYRNENH